MGAEGGVCWIYLDADSNPGEAQRILLPWWESLTYIGSSEKDRTRVFSPQAHTMNIVKGPYGDDGHDLSWRSLEQWVDHIRHLTSDPSYGLVEGSTFEDLWIEVETRPGWLENGSWIIQEWIDALGRFRTTDPSQIDIQREDFMAMSLATWLQEMSRIFRSYYTFSVETWT